MKARVSLIQLESPRDEPVDKRRDRVGEMLADAEESDLVILPELWGPGYFAFDRYERYAEPLNGDTVTVGGEWARKLGCYLHLGSVVERSPRGLLYNTAVLLDPTGEVVLTYRKTHLFGYRSQETSLLAAGDTVGVVASPMGTLATTTCYDLRFPELWRLLLDAGAEMIMVPAAWPSARSDHWRLLTACRALEEQVLLLSCNGAGVQGDVTLAGMSRVIDPWGDVIAEAGESETVLTCEVETGVVRATREEFPVLDDRRHDLICAAPHPVGDEGPRRESAQSENASPGSSAIGGLRLPGGVNDAFGVVDGRSRKP